MASATVIRISYHKILVSAGLNLSYFYFAFPSFFHYLVEIHIFVQYFSNINTLQITLVTIRFVDKTFLQNLLYLYYHKFPVFF